MPKLAPILKCFCTGGGQAGRAGLAAGRHCQQRLYPDEADAGHDGGGAPGLPGSSHTVPGQPVHGCSSGRPDAEAPAGQWASHCMPRLLQLSLTSEPALGLQTGCGQSVQKHAGCWAEYTSCSKRQIAHHKAWLCTVS